jgi:hypothetical protein
VDTRELLAGMLRLSMHVEMTSTEEVMRVYQVVTIAGFDIQFRTTVRSMSTAKRAKHAAHRTKPGKHLAPK